MKISFTLILIILLLSNKACSQSIPNNLIGHWLYIGTEETEKGLIECPDLLVLNLDGSYSLLNDCYGNEIEKPLIEQGKWIFDFNENKICLINRMVFGNYIFYNSSPKLELYIKESTDKILKLCFERNDCNIESFEKILD